MTFGCRAIGWGLLALVLVLTSASSGRAQTAIEEAARPLVQPPVWEVEAGVRTMFIKDAGYDPFSADDALSQFSLTATRALVRTGDWALAAGVGLDLGGSSATVRGAPSSLTLTRVSAVAEGRYQPLARLYLFARLAPGLLHGSASIDDASSPTASGLTATSTASHSTPAAAAPCASVTSAAPRGRLVGRRRRLRLGGVEAPGARPDPGYRSEQGGDARPRHADRARRLLPPCRGPELLTKSAPHSGRGERPS